VKMFLVHVKYSCGVAVIVEQQKERRKNKKFSK